MIDKQNAAIASVRITEKILGIKNSIEVVFKDDQYFNDTEISAVFLKEGYYIVFNNAYLENASIIEIMITGFHEVRHAYQYMQIEYGQKLPFKYKDSQLTIKEWKKDFDNLKLPSEMSREEYLNSPTEIDAIAFSYYLADKLLKVKQIIPDEIKKKVLNRVKEMNYIKP